MRNLFEHEKWTDASRELNRELGEAILPILKKWKDEGYSPRQIQLIAYEAASEAGISVVLGG